MTRSPLYPDWSNADDGGAFPVLDDGVGDGGIEIPGIDPGPGDGPGDDDPLTEFGDLTGDDDEQDEEDD